MSMIKRHYRDRSYHSHPSDDASLWRLIEHVVRREEDIDRRASAASQLRESIQKHDTKQFFMKNMDEVLNTLIDVFFERSEIQLQRDVARIISLIGEKLSSDPHPFFMWILNQLQSIANDNVRNYLLDSLHKLLIHDQERGKYSKEIVLLMDELQVTLESIDSPEHLQYCIKPLLLIATNHPEAFRKHFRDTVDILVGWHIDHTQRMTLILFAYESLKSLHNFWLNDLKFSLTMLEHFLEDMEGHLEGLDKLMESDSSKLVDEGKTRLLKIAALQRVFCTVVRSLGIVFNTSNGPPITEDFLLKCLKRIITCSQLAAHYKKSVMRASDECARLLIGAIVWRSESMVDDQTLLTYAVDTVENSKDHSRLLLAFELIIVMVQEIGSSLPDWFIQGLLQHNSRFMPLKHSRNKQYCSELLTVYQSCLAVKSLPLLQTSYNHIAGEFQEAINQLLVLHNGGNNAEYIKLEMISPKDNPYHGKLDDILVGGWSASVKKKASRFALVKGQKHESRLLKTALFNVVALLEIADAKNSLIGMYALTPNIFELFHKTLLVMQEKLASIYPSLQYAILKALYSHCQRNKNFTRSYIGEAGNSSLNDSSGRGVLDDVTAATRRHYPSILKLLSTFLLYKSCSFDSRTLMLHWSRQILDRLKSMKDPKLLETPGFDDLIYAITVAGLQNVPQHAVLSAKCLQVVQQLLCTVASLTPTGSGSALAKQQMQQASFAKLYKFMIKWCIPQLWNVNSSVRNAYTALLQSIPIDKIFSVYNDPTDSGEPDIGFKKLLSPQHLGLFGLKKTWVAKRIVSSTNETSAFHAHHFKDLIERMLKPNTVGTSHRGLSRSEFSSEWFEQLFWSTQRHGFTNSRSSMHTADETFVLYWTLWKAAEFVINSKLRTPLGKPPDTLQKIEANIREYERRLIASNLPNGSTSTSSGSGGISSSSGSRSHSKSPRIAVHASWAALQHPHLMLQFLYNLEKLMYNAYEGSAVSIPAQPKIIKTFFHTNRGTCIAWLNRLRLAVMRIALSCGLPAYTFQHGEAVLYDMSMRNNLSILGNDFFESAVTMTVEALVALKSPHAIEGIYRWCRGLVSPSKKHHWSWMKGAKLMASDNYEDALREFQLTLGGASKKQNGGESGLSGDASEAIGGNDGTLSNQAANTKQTISPPRSFMIQQTTKCYINLTRFKDAQEWLKGVPKDEYQSSYSSNHHYLQALGNYDLGEFKAATDDCQKLIGGTSSSSGTKSSLANGNVQFCELGGFSRPWNWNDLQCACEVQIINQAIKLRTSDKDNLSLTHLQQVTESALGCVRLQSSGRPSSIPSDFQAIYTLASSVKKTMSQEKKHLQVPLTPDIEIGSWLTTSTSNLLLTSMNHFIDKSCPKMRKSRSNLRMAMIQANRRNGNYNRAYALMCDELSTHQVVPDVDDDISELANVCGKLAPEKFALKLGPLHLQSRSAKLLHAAGKNSESIALLADSLASYLENAGKSQSEVCCRSLLILAKYLQADWRSVGQQLTGLLGPPSVDDSHLVSKLKIMMQVEKRQLVHAFANNDELVSEAHQEVILGTLYNLATNQAPDLSKSWYCMAGWCYKFGRKVIDLATQSGCVELMEEEMKEVEAILAPLTCNEEHIQEVYNVLKQSHCCTLFTQAEGDALDETHGGIVGGGVFGESVNSSSCKDANEAVLEQFITRCGSWLSRAPNHITQSLISVRHRVCDRVFHQLRISAESYFRFLHLNASQQRVKYEDSNVTATLRLMRLLVKHAHELKNTLENGFASTPTGPWKGIIPQLFSRLNHPELYVRQRITNLLRRVATHSPHLILYPVVVATTRPDPRNSAALRISPHDRVDDYNEETGSATQQATADDPTTSSAADNKGTGFCYSQVLQSLIEQDERKVRDIQLLVYELRRITVLWDELWLGTLNQHQQDIMRRLQQLHDEAKRVNNNQTLSRAEKQSILKKQREAILRPVVYAMKRVYHITSAKPETPHEKWFAEIVQPMVDSALEKLNNPPNPSNPKSCWTGFKQLHTFLESKNNKRSSHALSLGDISPKLLELKATTVPIPGVTDSTNKVSIQGCSSAVTTLPTKTKPKKMQFVGSDGRRYTYLFKGLEDLHLDERVMQFLSITNFLLRRAHSSRGYMARHYAVTPLGPRSGLIQWVTDAIPLFTLYKRWQQRNAVVQANLLASKAQASSSNNNNGSVQPPPPPVVPVLRPSDLFYAKLNAAAKKAGVDLERTPRKDWPKQILRSVFDELSKETPNDLLQREMWCAATCADESWSMQQKYTQSTAVMSMIGYVIGLGDRHLDNVLVDLQSGEVVHIDYNVCFEKGHQLRVPERVPFRLTQNLVRAFGVSGVHGVFRNSCEQVMQTLRKGRETLLTLLEAFIYDPLVDWTGTVEGGYAGAVYGGGRQQQNSKQGKDENKLSKKDMEREINRSLFSSRVAEMKQGWYKNRDEMVKTFPELIKKLNDYQSYFSNNQKIKERTESLYEVKSHVQSALSDHRHPYRTLPHRWSQFQAQQSKKDAVLNSLQDKIQKCDQNIKRYSQLLNILSSHQLAALHAETSTDLDYGSCPFKQAFKFLKSAGQANTVGQATATEKELMVELGQRRNAMRSCLDALSRYSGVATHFSPQAALYQHRDAVWSERLRRVCDYLLHNNSSDLNREIDSWHSKELITAQSISASSTDKSLLAEIDSLNAEYSKLMQRRNKEVVTSENGTSMNNINKSETKLGNACDDIFTFIQSNPGGCLVFTCAMSQTVIELNEGALGMEKHASAAGHRLVDQTSQEGDWFLEELSGLFANAHHLLNMNCQLHQASDPSALPEHMSFKLRETTKAVGCVDKVFRALLDLYNIFRNIILPEANKLLQSEEASAVKLVSEFNSLLQGVRPDDVVKQLMCYLRSPQNAVAEPGHLAAVLSEVETLRSKYKKLVEVSESKPSDQRKSGGEMLLEAFNNLFTAVCKDFNQLLTTRDEYKRQHVPPGWSIADALHESVNLQKLKNLSDNHRLVQAIMFVKQIQAMHTFFALAHHNAKSICVQRIPSSDELPNYQIKPTKQFYPEERLRKPIKFFVAFFVQEVLIGLPSEALAHSTCVYLEILGLDFNSYAAKGLTNVKVEQTCKSILESQHGPSQQLFTNASVLLFKYRSLLKAYDRLKRLEVNFNSVKDSQNRANLQMTRFHWLHEDLLAPAPSMMLGYPKRLVIVGDLNKRVNLLSNREHAIYQLREKMKAQHVTIQQRLRWAAGANRDLQTVLKSVDSDTLSREKLLKNEDALSRNIMGICESAVAFERNRLLGSGGKENNLLSRSSTSLSVCSDEEYMRLVTQAHKLCRSAVTSTVKIDDLEQTVVDILPPQQPHCNKTDDWLHGLMEKINSATTANKKQRQTELNRMSSVKSSIRENVSAVKQLLSNHGRLLTDVKALLKTLAKEENSACEGSGVGGKSIAAGSSGDPDANGQVGSVRSYMEKYMEFTSSLNETLQDIVRGCEPSTMLYPDPLIERLTDIYTKIDGLYEDLVAIASPNLEVKNSSSSNPVTFASALRGGSLISRSGIPNGGNGVGKLKNGESATASTGGGELSSNVVNLPNGSSDNSSTHASTGGGILHKGGETSVMPAALSKIASGLSDATAAASTPRKKARDPKTGKAIQERNNIACSVWKKVKLKLDGKDFDNSKRSLVSEQVDQIISEAINPDNNSRMYEGWTSWV